MSSPPPDRKNLEVITIRVPAAVRTRLIGRAKATGQPFSEYLRREITTMALGEAQPSHASNEAVVLSALEAVAKELADLRADERASLAVLLDRLELLTTALASGIEALLKLSASDATPRFTREEVRAFVKRAFRRSE